MRILPLCPTLRLVITVSDRPDSARGAGRLRRYLLPLAYLVLAGTVTAVQEWALEPAERAALVDWASDLP
jgi:hypothetical protein